MDLLLIRLASCILVGLSFAFLSIAPARSAVITNHCSEQYAQCYIFIKGNIDVGDSAKFQKLLQQNMKNGFVTLRLALMSPGGDVEEAINIGELVRSNLIQIESPTSEILFFFDLDGLSDTEIRERCKSGLCERAFRFDTPDGKYSSSKRYKQSHKATKDIIYDPSTICASACSLIALAGVERHGIVGLHHIYLPNPEIEFDQLDRVLSRGNASVQKYLSEIRVPQPIADLLFSTPSGELSWVNLADYTLDPIWNEYLRSKCNMLSEEEEETIRILSMLREFGSYYERDGTLVTRRITESEIRYLEKLSDQSQKNSSCIARETYNAQEKAQLGN